MEAVFMLVMSIVLLGGLGAFVVWAIRNPPTSGGSPRNLDRDTEVANAEVRAWTNGGAGQGGGSL